MSWPLDEGSGDGIVCPNCGGVRRLLAAIQDPDSAERVLWAIDARYRVADLYLR